MPCFHFSLNLFLLSSRDIWCCFWVAINIVQCASCIVNSSGSCSMKCAHNIPCKNRVIYFFWESKPVMLLLLPKERVWICMIFDADHEQSCYIQSFKFLPSNGDYCYLLTLKEKTAACIMYFSFFRIPPITANALLFALCDCSVLWVPSCTLVSSGFHQSQPLNVLHWYWTTCIFSG